MKSVFIGHFGLGFLFAFMVADKVTIDSLSYQKDAKPVHWESEGGIDYEMTEGEKAELVLSVVSIPQRGQHRVLQRVLCKSIIEKYCVFMPVSIFLRMRL